MAGGQAGAGSRRRSRPAARPDPPGDHPGGPPTPRSTGGPPRRSPDPDPPGTTRRSPDRSTGPSGPPTPGGEGGVHGGRHRDGQGRLAAVVAGGAPGREGALARLEDLDPGGEPLDRHQYRLEGAGVAGRVVGEQLQLRAASLGLAPARPGPDALGPRGRRAGDDAVGVDDGRQAVRRRPGGDHRPVGAPTTSIRGIAHHPVSARGAPGARSSPAGASPSPARARPAGPPGPTRVAVTMVPSGDGSQRRTRRSRAAAPRPETRTSTRRARRWRGPGRGRASRWR